MQNKNTYVACPAFDGSVRGEMVGGLLDTVSKGANIAFCLHKFSKLTGNFNFLLCDAINRKVHTHFLMIHADIAPMTLGWFNKMHEIMDETGADILSVVSPIKSPKGLTSIGLCEEETVPLRLKRFTLKEIHAMPETFTHGHLILNTGLMLINLRAPFVENVGRGLQFRVTDQILKMPDGKLKPFGGTEDWLFSLDARKFGAKLYATRAISIYHIGGHAWPNNEPYGIDSEEWLQS